MNVNERAYRPGQIVRVAIRDSYGRPTSKSHTYRVADPAYFTTSTGTKVLRVEINGLGDVRPVDLDLVRGTI